MKIAEEIAFEAGGDLGFPARPGHVPGTPVTTPDPGESASQQRMDRIIAILEDENETDLAGAMRLLAVEVASTLSPSSGGDLFQQRNGNTRIKNLRELSKQIQESADMSSRDFLNFDGPRFQYVFREIVLLFRASIIKGGLAAETADHILRVFYEEFLARELRLRQETSKLDPSTMASAFQVEAEPSELPDPPACPPNREVPHA